MGHALLLRETAAMPLLLQPLVLALHLLVPGALGAPVAAQPVAAQPAGQGAATAAARSATDRAAAEVAGAATARSQKLTDKQRLARQYDAELAEIDRLKRTRASWRRDRQIAAKKAESQATARALAAVDGELRAADARLARARKAMIAAIDGELRAGSARGPYLTKLRGEIDAQLRPRVRKLVLPDESLDVLADPDELAQQVALLERAELELRREQRLLAVREERYGKMARLRDQRDRAAELSQPDDEAVRRTTGAANPASGRGAADEQSDAPSSGAPPEDGAGGGGGGEGDFGNDGAAPDPLTGGDDGAGFEASSVVLADVVDRTTADALRRAGRSSDPRARAEAAARARKQVELRLERLTRSRALIQKHLRKHGQ
jgi:hypothetical protein